MSSYYKILGLGQSVFAADRFPDAFFSLPGADAFTPVAATVMTIAHRAGGMEHHRIGHLARAGRGGANWAG